MLPKIHAVIHKKKLSILKENAQKYNKLMSVLLASQYEGSEVGNRMTGFALSYIPQTGYSDISTVLPFFVGSVLTYAGITFDANKLVNSIPYDFFVKNVSRIQLLKIFY